MAQISEYNGLSQIGDLLSTFEASRIFLVTGKGSYEACGAKDVITKALAGHAVERFSDFDVNPKIEDGIKGAQQAKEFGADLILAVGGGSPMDVAKLIKAFLSDVDHAKDFVTGVRPLSVSAVPLLCVPTTAGSGSEATHFAVVYIGSDKYSLAHPDLLPNAMILDGKLLKSAPAYQRAINGLDALAQATEGAWAAKSTQASRPLSFQAIEALLTYLPAVIEGDDPQALQAVMVAAHQAGQVINVTKTTAAHAFSYAFTSLYDVPHGHAVWLTLPSIFAVHMKPSPEAVTDPRGAKHFADVMNRLAELYSIDSAKTAEARLKAFMASVGVEPSMIKMGAQTHAARALVASKVNKERLGNNPVALSDADISCVFHLGDVDV